MKKIRMLMVLGTMNNGGTEAFVMNYYGKIDKKKFDVDFLIIYGPNEYYRFEIEKLGGTIYHLSMEKTNRYWRNLRKIYFLLKHNRYDIVHIHACSLKCMIQISLPAKLAGNCKIIGHSHSMGEPKGSSMDAILRKFLKIIISRTVDLGMACSSEAGGEKYSDEFLRSDRYFIIPNAINTSTYTFNQEKRTRIRCQYHLEDSLVVGIVGRLEKEKNQTFLLDVLAELNQKCSVYLLMVGEGDIKADLKEKAEKLGVGQNTIFTGMVNDAYAYYSAMDVFCLPSYAEGFPFVLVEAQANGLKCLVSTNVTRETNVSGTVEYLPACDPKEWADRIVEIGKTRISDEARRRVEEKYDLNNTVRILENCYENLVLRGCNRSHTVL